MDFLYAGLLALGLALVFFAWKQWQRTAELERTGLKAMAKVTELIAVSGDDGPTWKPVFEYKDYKGTTCRYTSDLSSRPPAYEVGELVEIVYKPGEHDQKVMSFWGLYSWPVIFLCIALPLLVIGGGYLLYRWA